MEACDRPDGYVSDRTDCDDDDALVHPDADEICNGVDDDCDGLVDDEDPDVDLSTSTSWYRDSDGDGFGDDDDSVESCSEPSGYVLVDGDCDDGNAGANPDAIEICDGVDNDCDGSVDNDAADPTTWYRDADADRFGNPDDPIDDCEPPSGYVGDDTDCDDTNAEINPGMQEIEGNGIDDDCSPDTGDGPAEPPEEDHFRGGCACSSPSAPAGWLALPLLALLRRRR